VLRFHALGSDVHLPSSPGAWKVSLVVHGVSQGDARLLTATPLDGGRQHVLRECCHSAELLDRPPDAKHPERRQVVWVKRGGADDGPFRTHYDFICTIDSHRADMRALRPSDAAPGPGEHLDVTARTSAEREELAALARRLIADLDRPRD